MSEACWSSGKASHVADRFCFMILIGTLIRLANTRHMYCCLPSTTHAEITNPYPPLVQKFLFFFDWRVIYNVMLVSAVHQCESALCIHTSLLSWAFIPAPHPTHLRYHIALGWAPCIMQHSYSPKLSVLHVVIYVCPGYSLNLSLHPTLSFPHYVPKSVVYACVSLPALQIGYQYHFSRFYIHVLIYNISFSLPDLLLCAADLGSSTSLQLTQKVLILVHHPCQKWQLNMLIFPHSVWI